jgi:hypothetical protein
MQNVLLWLGALLVAITGTGYLLRTLGGSGRVAVFAVLAAVVLALALPLARRGLTSTAETVASIGLLFVLLDGYAAWTAHWFSGSGLSGTGYGGLLCLVVAGVSAGYRTLTHLRAPRFATLLLLQPVLPLLATGVAHDVTGWAAVLAAVAAEDLGLALFLRGRPNGTPYVRDAVWGLHFVAVLAAMVTSTVALTGAHTVHLALAGAAALLLAAAVGLGGGLMVRRFPFPDVGAGLATLAVIVALGRLAAVAVPGIGLICAASAVVLAAVGALLLGPLARRGPMIAATLAAAVLGLIILINGLPAIIGPIRAASPPWRADLTRYQSTVVASAGHHTWQLAVAALILTVANMMLLPHPVAGRSPQSDAAVIGLTLSALLLPSTTGMPWAGSILLLVLCTIAVGAYGLAAHTVGSAWVRVGAAALLGSYATTIAVARAGAGAVTFTAFAVAGTVIGVLPILSTAAQRPTGAPEPPEMPERRRIVGDAALGGAAFAFPGAVAFATAALIPQDSPRGAGAVPILAAAFLAVAGSLGVTAVTQVARGRSSPLLVGGASLGAVTVAFATFRTPNVSLADLGVAAALLVSAVLLCLAPTIDASPRFSGQFDGSDVAAAAVTVAGIAALSRVAGLASHQYELAIAAGLVLLVALGVRAMPPEWQRGPSIGSGIVGIVVGLIAGASAVVGGLAVLSAIPPVWHTDLATWTHRVATAAGTESGQVPIALLLIAWAAALVLPRPLADVLAVAGLGLAALGVPAAYHLPWWSPIAISGIVATGCGIAAGLSRPPETVAEMGPDDGLGTANPLRIASVTGWARATIATVLCANTIAASLVNDRTTAGTLIASALVFGMVAATCAYTRTRYEYADYLTTIGGAALAGALAALAAGMGVLALARHESTSLALTAALAGACLGLGLVGAASYQTTDTLLPYATAGVALVGTAIAVGTLDTHLPVEVYAAITALVVVVAELMRSAIAERNAAYATGAVTERPRPRHVPHPGRHQPSKPPVTPSFRPNFRDLRQRFRPQRLQRPEGYLLLVAAGPAAVLAAVRLAPTVFAVLAGPYRWVNMIWTAAPRDSVAALGSPLQSWVGGADEVVAALILTFAAALGAIGFGGSAARVQARAVAVVIPCAALTLLIAPAALRMPWPAGPLAAVIVAALCGLGVALTPQPADSRAGEPLRASRRLVIVICLLAGGAGLAGSLATRHMTLLALAAATATGLGAALGGRSRPARTTGWLVTTLSGNLLALVIGSVAGLAVYWSAFLVGIVAAGLLLMSALLPRLRRPEAGSEAITVEAGAYAGAVLGALLAARSLPHLAVFLCAWGAVLGVAAMRPNRPRLYRNVLTWTAWAHEVVAWWLLMHVATVALPEAYTLAVAVVALILGYTEARRHPEISSWLAYGVALVAAFVPSLAIVLATGQTPLRRAVLILAAAATVALGSIRRQQAPVMVGSVVLTVAALHELAVLSTALLLWTLIGLVGALLVGLGANFEKRRRDIGRLRGALGRLR